MIAIENDIAAMERAWEALGGVDRAGLYEAYAMVRAYVGNPQEPALEAEVRRLLRQDVEGDVDALVSEIFKAARRGAEEQQLHTRAGR